MMRHVVAVAVIVTLGACAAPFGTGAGGYECGGLPLTADQLAAAPPATELPPEVRAAFSGEGYEIPEIDLADGWRVIEATSDTVGLLRPLEEPVEIGPGDLRTHDQVRAHRSQGSTNVPDGAWVLDSAGPCTPRRDLGRLGQADLVLAERPDRGDASIALEVHERACASGESAEGRVEVVEQEVTDEEVRLVIGVRPRGGSQDCPSNPPTPFTVELDEPVGDRTVVDASVLPPRPLEAAP